MKAIINVKETYVWLFLGILTFLAWVLSGGENPDETSFQKTVTVSLFLVAFFKIRLVVLYFMELKTAPVLLRGAFEAWIIIVCAVVIGLYLFV